MKRSFSTPTTTVNFMMLGSATGGFSSKFVDAQRAAENQKLLTKKSGARSVTLMRPDCGTNQEIVDESMKEVQADVLITQRYDHGLMILPADCIPLVIYDTKSPLLALVHCSRKGLDNDIVKMTITSLRRLSPRADLRAYLGPGIKASTYVHPTGTVRQLKHDSWRSFTKSSKTGIHVDIFGFTKHELIGNGIAPQSIMVSSINTAGSRVYYSHYNATRNGKENGRNGAIVVISPRLVTM